MPRHRIDPARSRVWIEARSSVHPIHSSTDGLEGWIDLGLTRTGRIDQRTTPSAHLELAVANLRSSNPLEERELRRRIDARRFPLIEGDLVSIEPAPDADDDGDAATFVVHGNVTFRGVTRPHTDRMTITADDDGSLHLVGQSTFDVRDFGMEPPRILMLRVEPVVGVQVEIVAVPE